MLLYRSIITYSWIGPKFISFVIVFLPFNILIESIEILYNELFFSIRISPVNGPSVKFLKINLFGPMQSMFLNDIFLSDFVKLAK